MDTLHPEARRLQRLHDEAFAEAQALRREAMADFWRGADGLVADAAVQTRRAADRFARSLGRRLRKQRATPATA